MSPEIQIEKGIPIPPVYRCGKWGELLQRMETGDSFTVADSKTRSMLSHHAHRYKVKITTRKINGSGYRIWKIK